MSLSSTEKQLIFNSLKTLPLNAYAFVYKNLLSVIASSDWAKSALFASLEEGVQFLTTNNTMRNHFGQLGFISYNFVENVIHFNFNYVNSTIPTKIINDFFSSSVRHILVSYVDIRDLLENNLDVYHRLNRFAVLTNSLINQIHCVMRTSQINPQVLDQLINIFNQFTNNFVVQDFERSKFDFITKMVQHFGSNPFSLSSPAHYITNLWQFIPSSSACLLEITADLHKIDALFRSTEAVRAGLPQRGVVEKEFHTNFLKGVSLFKSLKPHQRKVFEILLLVIKRITNNLPRDPECFNAFNECVSDINANDCVANYLECWDKSPLSKHDKVNANLSLLQMVAPWFEKTNAESGLFHEGMFDGLCRPTAAEKVVVTPTTKTAFNLIDGAYYNFLNEAVNSYTSHRKLASPVFWNTVIMFLFLCIYDLAKGFLWDKEEDLSALIPHILTHLFLVSFLQLIDKLFNSLSPKVGATLRPVTSAVVLSADVIIQGPRKALPTLATSIVINVPVNYLAKSICKGLGWQPEVKKVEEQPLRNQFEKKYR